MLKDVLDKVSGLRFVIDRTPILSAVGRRYLYASDWQTDPAVLDSLYAEMDRMAAFVGGGDADAVADFDHLVSQTRDIENTVDGLMGGMILGDIEFFEIKAFALVAERLRSILEREHLADMPSLAKVVDILDPERTRVSAFHIYDLYSQELAEVRAQLKKVSAQPFSLNVDGTTATPVSGGSTDEAAALYQRSLALEDAVRKDLAFQLRPLAHSIRTALRTVAHVDIIQAKVRLAGNMGFVKPVITDNSTCYRALFNPQVADVLAASGKKYQPVDISFGAAPTLISGINMGGKTVFLKTVALAQHLCQFGFFVPAAEASIALVDRVMTVFDDNQSELSGLSSFAGEMRQIDAIIRAIRHGGNLLVLVDELARTTNPVEGRAIVEAMLHILEEHNVRAFVSSHYDNIISPARRLRVKGLRDDIRQSELDVDHLDRYIDYSLVPDTDTAAPHEALRIAALIGIDPDFIDICKHKLNPMQV